MTEPISVFTHLNLFALSLLITSDLGEGLGLSGALLLNFDATEFLGDSLNTLLAFWAIAMMGRAIRSVRSKWDAQSLMDDNDKENNLKFSKCRLDCHYQIYI